MKKGKVLKVRLGHDANCSSEAYIGTFLILAGGYAALTVLLIAVQAALESKRFADRAEARAARRGWWVVPQLLALGVVLVVMLSSGAMDYSAGLMCFLPLAAIILVVTLVGAALFKPKEETPAL